MAEYLAPGVYMEEVESGAVPIEGVSTSTAGFLGETERGPVVPQFLTSFEDFRRHFGGFAHYRRDEPLYGTSLAYAVQGYFENGGQRCYVGRVTDEEVVARRSVSGYVAEPQLDVSVTDVDAGDVTGGDVAFGTVVTGRTVTATVRLANPGIENDPATTIESVDLQVRSGDGTQVRLAEAYDEAFEVRAGQHHDLTVEYVPTSENTVEVDLVIEHAAAADPVEIGVEGTGQTPQNAVDVQLSPGPVEFGYTSAGAPVERQVTIANDGAPGAAPVTLTGISPTDTTGSQPYTADPDLSGGDEIELERGEETTVTVTFDHGTAGDDPVEETLEVAWDDSGTGSGGPSSPATVPLRGGTIPSGEDVGTDTRTLEFGEVNTGLEASRRVTVWNTGDTGDPITVEVANVTGDFTAGFLAGQPEATLRPQEETDVLVTFTPQSGSPKTGTLTLREVDTGEERKVDLEGTGNDAAGVLEPADVDFGGLVVGDTRTRSIELVNEGERGASTVTVDEVSIDGTNSEDPDAFLVDEDDPTGDLAVGESMEVSVEFTPQELDGAEATLVIAADLNQDGTTDDVEVTLTGRGTEAATGFEAVGPGAWGGRVAIEVRNSSRDNETFRVTVRYWSELAEGGGSSRERLAAQGDPDRVETFDGLSTDEASSNYYVSRLESSSFLVDVDEDAVTGQRPDNGVWFLYHDEDAESDDGVGLGDFEGDATRPRGERDGLEGFEERDDISIVCIPDENKVENLTGVAADHCERMEDRFAVMQAEAGADPGDLPYQGTISDYGAFYYPHIRVVDPETNERKLVPPGGHVAGVYARTDADRGVHKAPANETVRGAVGLELPITKADQERLNPKGVNAIRSFEGRGIRIWGARTTSPNPLWKYVNVRRLLLYIEESIEEGTQWAVFEPNNEELWARLRQSVRNFLTTVWRTGALMGSTPEEAFYVKCDRSTMTQDDIDNGRLIVEIGVAPTKPAEFVVFRITQWTGGVEGGE